MMLCHSTISSDKWVDPLGTLPQSSIYFEQYSRGLGRAGSLTSAVSHQHSPLYHTITIPLVNCVISEQGMVTQAMHRYMCTGSNVSLVGVPGLQYSWQAYVGTVLPA